MKKKRGKKAIMWILIVLGVLVVGMGAAMLATAPGRKELAEMTFPAASFAPMKQGTYVGEYIGSKDQMRNTKVQVTVAGGKLSDIKVLSGSTVKDDKPIEIRHGESIDDLSKRVMDAQSLHVDVISGATLTSNAHLKAIGNAVSQAEGK
jgi:uncharacterized protein with FMN-binding domain